MTSLARTTALVPAAGQGLRVGANQNKVLLPLLNVPVLIWTLRALEQSESIDNIVVIAQENDVAVFISLVREYGLRKVSQFVHGGPERQDSVFNGLTRAETLQDIVLIHDAARPLASSKLIQAVANAAHETGAAIAAIPVADTLVKVENELRLEETVPRDHLWRVQTPQAFQRDLIMRAYENAGRRGLRATDDATLVRECGHPVKIVAGEATNWKLTEKADFAAAEAFLKALGFR